MVSSIIWWTRHTPTHSIPITSLGVVCNNKLRHRSHAYIHVFWLTYNLGCYNIEIENVPRPHELRRTLVVWCVRCSLGGGTDVTPLGQCGGCRQATWRHVPRPPSLLSSHDRCAFRFSGALRAAPLPGATRADRQQTTPSSLLGDT